MRQSHDEYSVVIPSLGRWGYLKELLNSIMRQSILPKEVIVLLNDHEEYDKDFLVDFQNDLHHTGLYVRVVHCQKNLAEKRNFGVTLSTTSYIFFSDDDDIWAEDKAKCCLKELKKYSVVTHNFSKFGDRSKVQCSQLGHHDRTIKLSINLPGDNVYGGGSSIAARKSLLVEIPFKTSLAYCEDLDWWLSVLGTDRNIKYIGLDLVSYRSHRTNMTKQKLMIYYYTMLVIRHQAFRSITMFILCLKIFTRCTAKMLYKLAYA